MPRPRKSSTGKTSFGKRSEAEKSFYHKKKERYDSKSEDKRPRAPRSADQYSSSSPRSSKTGKPSFGRKEEGVGGFSKRTDRKDEGSAFGKRPFQRRDSDSTSKPPFRKREAGSFSRDGERPNRFEKKPFERRDRNEGGQTPFKKREAGSFSRDGERPNRFEKKPFERRDRKEGDEKPPFKKREAGSFSKDGERPNRFEKKPFERRERNEGDEKPPFKKREAGSFSKDGERPNRFEKKPFERRERNEGDEKPAFRKRESNSFDSKSEDKPEGKSEDKPRFEKKSFERKKEGDENSPAKGDSFGLPYKRKTFNRTTDIKTTKRNAPAAKQKSDPDLIRLNRFLANSGVGSRREADELIKMGLVTVNGETVTEMGHKVKLTDEVRYEGKKLKAEKPVYILLNKPKGFITTTDDPQDRNTVMALVANAGKERIYPVGRLDRNTTGLLMLTNDGDLADKLTHPSYGVKKIYKVELDKPLSKNDFVKIKDGVHLEEGRAMVDDLAIIGDDNKVVGLELHIGWNRIVRRIFESLDYQVIKLDRVVYAGLDKKDLGRGQWRFLKPEEVVALKHFK
jgi:23S rRNA pseudouridine2605 synthase